MSNKHSKGVARQLKGPDRRRGSGVPSGRNRQEAVGAVQVPQYRRGSLPDIDGWDAGKYPEKVSKEFIDLLENVEANADHQGFDGESSMEIVHAAAHKVGESVSRKPRAMGRCLGLEYATGRRGVVVEEVEDEEDDS